MVKLALSDTDGTLLPFGERTISERTHHAIRSLMDAGITFGACSGRDRADLEEPFLNDEALLQTGIMSNGKKVFANGYLVFRKELDHSELGALVDIVRRYRGSSAWLTVDEDSTGITSRRYICGVTPDDGEALRNAKESGRSFEVASGVPNLPAITGGVYIDTQFADPAEVRNELEAACPDLDFPAPAPFFLDVVPKGWSKANGVGPLLESLNIDLDEVAFFGDSENDLTMLRLVPSSYAVANASPEAAAAAHFHIGNASDDAVAEMLEGWVAAGEP
mgnify:CR=1 FL=1